MLSPQGPQYVVGGHIKGTQLTYIFQNRYRELMQVSREWRNLQAMKRSGLGHEPNHRRKPGDLALFCPTCPQPGINVPPRNMWLEHEKYIHNVVILGFNSNSNLARLLFRPSYVTDGNMKLQHLLMRRPEDDVFL